MGAIAVTFKGIDASFAVRVNLSNWEGDVEVVIPKIEVMCSFQVWKSNLKKDSCEPLRGKMNFNDRFLIPD